MKVIKARLDLVYFFFIPFTLMAIFLFFYPPNWISLLHDIHWPFLLAVLISMVKLRKITLGTKRPFDSFPNWLIKLFLLQLLLNVFLWGVYRFVTIEFPILVPFKSNNHFFKFILQTGFFPWGITALTAIMMGYVVYFKNRRPLFSSLYNPCYKNHHNDSIGVAVDSYLRLICMMMVIFVIIFFSLAVLNLLSHHFILKFKTGFYFSLVVLNSFLIFLVSNKFWNKIVRFGTFNLQPTVLIFLFAMLLSSIVIVGEPFIVFLMQKIQFPDVRFFNVNQNNWPIDLTIFIDFIALSFAVIIGSIVAYISQGRRLTLVVLNSFIMNLLAWLLIYALNNVTQGSRIVGTWILLTSCLIFLQALNKPVIYYLIRGSLPTDKSIKPRSPLLFMRTLLSTSTFLFSLYLCLGIYILSFISVLSLLPPVFVVIIGASCFIKHILREK